MDKTTVIVVGGTKGGPGKSTIAQQIACCLLIENKKSVYVIDIDYLQQTTAKWCEERKSNKDIAIIPYAAVFDRIAETIDRLRGQYPFVVVDAGGFDSEAQREAMLAADILVIPIRPKRRDLKSMRDLEIPLTKAKSQNTGLKVFVVMNQCPALPSQVSRIIYAKEVVKTFGLEVVPTNIYNRNVYDDAEWGGSSIFEVEKKERDPKAEAEIKELVEYILSDASGRE